MKTKQVLRDEIEDLEGSGADEANIKKIFGKIRKEKKVKIKKIKKN